MLSSCKVFLYCRQELKARWSEDRNRRLRYHRCEQIAYASFEHFSGDKHDTSSHLVVSIQLYRSLETEPSSNLSSMLLANRDHSSHSEVKRKRKKKYIHRHNRDSVNIANAFYFNMLFKYLVKNLASGDTRKTHSEGVMQYFFTLSQSETNMAI